MRDLAESRQSVCVGLTAVVHVALPPSRMPPLIRHKRDAVSIVLRGPDWYARKQNAIGLGHDEKADVQIRVIQTQGPA